ncbi:MAG: sulfurtransferase complex subunit TusC [Enterobacterales bacterium]
MNSVAFIFSNGPYGINSGREGLESLLVISSFIKKIGIFFISDGIFLLLVNKKHQNFMLKDFTKTFKILSLYKINELYLCINSAEERGVFINTKLLLNVKWLNKLKICNKLNKFDTILVF